MSHTFFFHSHMCTYVTQMSTPALRTTPPSHWDTALCDVCGGPDTGRNCCVQNCCCQPCVWGDGLRRIGLRDSTLYTFAALCGSDTLLDEAAGYFARAGG